MTNQLFRDLLDGNIPMPRPWNQVYAFAAEAGAYTYATGWADATVIHIHLGRSFAAARRVFLNQLINAQDKYEHHHVAPVIGWIDEWHPLPGDELDWIIQDDTDPRTRALAAKAARGKGPQSPAGWRGKERNTKYRSK